MAKNALPYATYMNNFVLKPYKRLSRTVRGQWQSHVKVVQAPLLKNELASGERIVGQ